MLNLARHAKRDLPEDLTANGTISASFHASRMSEAPSTWIGNLVVNGLVVHSAVLGKDLAVNKVVATVNTAETPRTPAVAAIPQNHRRPLSALWWCIASTCRSAPALRPRSTESLDDERFALHLKGDATLERLAAICPCRRRGRAQARAGGSRRNRSGDRRQLGGICRA